MEQRQSGGRGHKSTVGKREELKVLWGKRTKPLRRRGGVKDTKWSGKIVMRGSFPI